MVLQGVRRFLKSFGRVTISAASHGSLPDEISFMVIPMAVDTFFMFQRIGQAAFMA